jgi:hypothetical protein
MVVGPSGILDTAVHKISYFIVDFLREFEAIFKKALTRVRGDFKFK